MVNLPYDIDRARLMRVFTYKNLLPSGPPGLDEWQYEPTKHVWYDSCTNSLVAFGFVARFFVVVIFVLRETPFPILTKHYRRFWRAWDMQLGHAKNKASPYVEKQYKSLKQVSQNARRRMAGQPEASGIEGRERDDSWASSNLSEPMEYLSELDPAVAAFVADPAPAATERA